MKILNTKRYLAKRYLLMMLVSFAWLGCEDDPKIDYGNSEAPLQHTDPYLQVVTGFIPFEIGTPSYDFEFNLVNGIDEIENVRLYGSFFDSESGLTSNEIIYGEYPVNEPLKALIQDNFTYDELKAGLLVGGSELPVSDVDIAPGSGWSFRFEGDYASGRTGVLAGSINMVLSKYAGNYEVIESSYFRIGADNGDWDGQVIFIGFVDQVTLSHNDFWGPLPWAGKSFHITVNPDNSLTAPVLTADGIRNVTTDGFLLTCVENASKFDNVPCAGSNKIVDDEGGPGRHRIYLTYGYEIIAGATGTREFYEVLERVVD